MSNISHETNITQEKKTLLVVFSIHHNNTMKIAETMAPILDAEIVSPKEIDPEQVQRYDLVGFGSGIYGDKHHISLLELAEKLPNVSNKKTFLFSTSGMSGKEKTLRDHKPLREKLEQKGYNVLDDFNCPGFDTNTSYESGLLLSIVSWFVNLIGGINKGRPNASDLSDAERFAEKMRHEIMSKGDVSNE